MCQPQSVLSIDNTTIIPRFHDEIMNKTRIGVKFFQISAIFFENSGENEGRGGSNIHNDGQNHGLASRTRVEELGDVVLNGVLNFIPVSP